MSGLLEKYGKHFCQFMGSFTFDAGEMTAEIERDMKDGGFSFRMVYDKQVIFSEDLF